MRPGLRKGDARAKVGVEVPLSSAGVRVVTRIAAGAAGFSAFREDALPHTTELNTTSADLTVYGDDGSDSSRFSMTALPSGRLTCCSIRSNS